MRPQTNTRGALAEQNVLTVGCLTIPTGALHDFCHKHNIKRLWLFGSVLRDDFRPESDVDVLYEFAEGKTPGFAIFSIEDELSRLFGRKVDFVPERYLDWKIKKHPSFKPELIYDEG